MKEILIAGDSIDEEVEAFDSAGNEYSGDDGWQAKYVFIPRTAGSGAKFEIVCSWTGDAFRYQVSATASATWTPAEYSWTLVVYKTGLRVTLENGTATVVPNLDTATAYDARSQAQKALDDAKAALAQFNATSGRVKSYSIAGRSMEFESAAELIKLVRFWQLEVEREATEARLAQGLNTSRTIRMRF